MNRKQTELDELIAGVLAGLEGEGTVYRNGESSAIILLEDRIVTVSVDGTIAEASLAEWNTLASS